MRKFVLASLAVLPLALSTASLRADSYDISLKTGATVDALVTANVIFDGVAAKQYTYVNEQIGLLGAFGAVLSSSTSTFTATYASLSPIASVLSVTDVCANVYFLGSTPGCQNFAFSFNNVKLGDGEDGIASATALVLASVNVGVGLADLNINGSDLNQPQLVGLSIDSASGNFNFGPPPVTAATPEPSSLCLMATGLATAAGAIRRKAKRSIA